MAEIAQAVAYVACGQIRLCFFADQYARARHEAALRPRLRQRAQPYRAPRHVVAATIVHASARLLYAVLYKSLAVHILIGITHVGRLHRSGRNTFSSWFHTAFLLSFVINR